MHKVYALDGIGEAGRAAIAAMTPRGGGKLREAMSCITPRSDGRLEAALNSMEMKGDHVRVMRSGAVIRFSSDPKMTPQVLLPPESRLHGTGGIDHHVGGWKMRSP